MRECPYSGSMPFTEEQAEWFVRGRSPVHIILDNDNAGFYAGWLRYGRLIAAGHTRIGMIAGSADDAVAGEPRVRGFVAAFDFVIINFIHYFTRMH